MLAVPSHCGLPLGTRQLWRCPVGWCTVWKGTAKDSVGHLRDRHGVAASVELKTLGRYFPWTVKRKIWNKVLCSDVSGIAMDVMLFHEHGRWLVNRYMIFSDPLPHVSLRRTVISKLLVFTHRAMAVAQLNALHMSISSSGTSISAPVGVLERCLRF